MRVERIGNLAIPNDNDADGTDRGAIVIGRLKIYCCKVLHICSVLIIPMFSCSELFFIERFSINGHFGGDIQWKCF